MVKVSAGVVATYEGLGLKFFYPENWALEESSSDESSGVTVESPDGTFFSVNRYVDQSDAATILKQAAAAMREEYQEMESSPLEDDDRLADEAGIELHFYYLDLLIISRLLAIPHGRDILLVQMQGESRDFDESEAVFSAMLKSLRDSLA